MLFYDRYQNLYLRKGDVLKIRQGGKLETLKDESERRVTHSSSANVAFPHVFPNGEKAVTDFKNYALAHEQLKKQCFFAHTMESGKLQWSFAEDDIYLMHTYARIAEMRVSARVSYYLQQHPYAAHLPIESVVNAFKHGFDDQGLLNCKLTDITRLLTQLPHSRNFWFQERQGLESFARNFISPNLFLRSIPSKDGQMT